MATFGPALRVCREPSWGRFVLALTTAVGGCLFLLKAALFTPLRDAGPALGIGGLFAFLGTIATLVTARTPRVHERPGLVEVKDGLLSIDRRVVVRAATRTAIERDEGTYRVQIFEQARTPTVTVSMDTYAEAELLREALAIEESPLASFRVAGRSTLAGRLAMTFGLIAIGAGGILGVMTSAPVWFLLSTLGLMLLRISGRATVGADGIVVSCLGVETFVPFADVLRVERDDAVVVHRADGTTIRLRETPGHPVVDKMLERIERARAAMLDTAATERLLAQGERSDREWRSALARLSAPGYRSAAIERERLWEVFENPGAEPSARRGAAMLLRSVADEPERVRLVRIREAVASPELREQLLEDEDAGTGLGATLAE